MANTEPFVALACICENILRDGDVYSAIKIVDTVAISIPTGFQGTPSVVFNILVGLKSGDVVGKSELALAVRRPSGKPASAPQPWPILLNGGEHGVILHGKIQLPATEFGLFWFDVLWNGKRLTSIPLKLVQGLPVTPQTNEPAHGVGDSEQPER